MTAETSFDFADGMAADVLFWVPLDAPIEEMDVGASTAYACAPELTSWLIEHGTLITTPQAVLIRSSADEKLDVQLRAQGSFRSADPGFVVQCGTPGITGGEGFEGELEWELALVRFADGGVEALAATDDGPKPMQLSVDGGQPTGLLVLVQGDEAFEGQLVASTDGTQGIAVPLRGADEEATTDIYWPGIPPSGTLRVAIAADPYTDEIAFLCSAASQAAYAALQCAPNSGPVDEQIRAQAVRYRDNYDRVQERERLRTSEPQPTTAAGSSTKLTRLDPWADPAMADKTVYGVADGCYRDAYRLDRVNCSASLTCYLNADESLGACYLTDSWEVFTINEMRELPPAPDAEIDVEMLRLADGSVCRFSTGAGPNPPAGFDGWVGSCHDGADVLWAKHREEMPLDQTFLFEPTRSGGLLQIAAGPEEVKPTFYDVAEILY
ncbi:MAG: hypothetical protein J0H70_11870 [Microbacterium chocolatum]|nr:hypothetical protein [Microbacterium chocolatum]